MQTNKFLSSRVERLEPLTCRKAKELVDDTLNSVGQSGLTNAEHDNLLKLSEALEDMDRMESGQPPLQRGYEHADEPESHDHHQHQQQQSLQGQLDDEGLGAQQMPASKPAINSTQQQQQQEQQEPESHSKRKEKRKLEAGTPPAAASAAASENGDSIPHARRKKKRKDSAANGELGDAGTLQQEAVQQQANEPGEHHGVGGKEQDRRDAQAREEKVEGEDEGGQVGHHRSEKKKKKKKREREGSIGADGEEDGVKNHKKHKRQGGKVAYGVQ